MINENQQAADAVAPKGADRPLIHAVTEADGTGVLTIDGSTIAISEPTLAAARGAITGAAADTAARLGRPVRMMAVGPDGEWQLIVHADGTVEAESTPDGPVPSEARPDDLVEAEIESAADTDLAADTDARAPVESADPAGAPAWEAVPAGRVRAGAKVQSFAVHAVEPGGQSQQGRPVAPAASSAAVPWPGSASGSDRTADEPRWDLPTLDDFLATQPKPPPSPPEWGWQSRIARATHGAINPRPSQAELVHRGYVADLRRTLTGPRTIAVINPKGGAHKTTASILIAATFGMHRGGYTLAWDNNETRGTLGWRTLTAQHKNTAVNLLADLGQFEDATRSRVGDLDSYVRSQGSAMYDVLASDEDAGASASIDSRAFNRLHATLSRFYRIMVVDTGNNMRSTNWGAAVAAADQLVIVSTVREDTAASAAWLIDGLRQRRYEDKVAQAVTLLSAAGRQPDTALNRRLHEHFGQLTRAVIDVPFDPALVDGTTVDVNRLQPGTRMAWLQACSVIASGL